MLVRRLRGRPVEDAFRWRAVARAGGLGVRRWTDRMGATRLKMELSLVLIPGTILAWQVKGRLCCQ